MMATPDAIKASMRMTGRCCGLLLLRLGDDGLAKSYQSVTGPGASLLRLPCLSIANDFTCRAGAVRFAARWPSAKCSQLASMVRYWEQLARCTPRRPTPAPQPSGPRRPSTTQLSSENSRFSNGTRGRVQPPPHKRSELPFPARRTFGFLAGLACKEAFPDANQKGA
jgi:hypothetical protein